MRATLDRLRRPGEVSRAFDDLVADRIGAFEALWATMPGSEKSVLRAVAAGVVQLHGQAARRDHDLPTSSTITKAGRSAPTRAGHGGPHRGVNPP